MSHGHDHHDDHGHEEYEGHGHDDHGHDGHGHEEPNLHDHRDGSGHNDEGEVRQEPEEPLLFPAGIMNDLSSTGGNDSTVDLSEFFPVRDAFAVNNNGSKPFNDVRSWTGKPLDFSRPRALRISKYRTKKTSDILKRSECSPSLVAYVDKNRPVRPEPLSVIEPLEIPDFAFDLRNLEPLPTQWLHPDVYALPIPLPKRFAKHVKKHRAKILKAGFSSAIVAVALISGTAGIVSYAQTGVEKAYGDLFALWEAAKLGPSEFLDRTESAKARFSLLKLTLSPVLAAFDSPVLSIASIKTAGNVVRGGAHLAEAASILGEVWEDFAKETSHLPTAFSAFGSGSTFKATDFYRKHSKSLRKADLEISMALAEYSQIETLGNSEMDAKFRSGVTLLLSAQGKWRFLFDHEEGLLAALGDRSPQRYLVLNQNRDELRPTGGFPWSAIFVEFYKGRLVSYEKKDIYYYDWHLFPHAEPAPEWLDRLSEKWGLRDANYFPEMKRNFETVDRFFQKSGGSSLNGLIAMNQGIVIELLERYGPIALAKIGKTVDASNFSMLMSVLVENKVTKVSSPKDVLFDFVVELEKRLLERKDFAGYFEIFDRNAKSGEILAYSNDPEANALFEEVFPGEKNRKFEGNFAYPLFTSISGNKSDRYVRREFEIKSEPMDACRALNGFRMESDHRMSVDDKERVRGLLYDLGVPLEEHEKQIFIQGNGDNRQYVRVLVPKGSRLSGTPPIQITVDDSLLEYTVFAFYLTTSPGQKSAAFFDYESDIANCEKKPVFHAQPGLVNYDVKLPG